MRSTGLSAAKVAIASLLLIVPALVFLAFSDRGDARWTAQSQIFHRGRTWVETEAVKLSSRGMLEPVAAAEAMTVDQLLQDWEVGLAAKNFFVADRPDTQLLKLEYTSEDPSQALRVVTAVSDRYINEAALIEVPGEARQRLLDLEAGHTTELRAVTERMESLDESSVSYAGARSTQEGLEEAIEAVQMQRAALTNDNRTIVSSEIVASPFLLPQGDSNALSQFLLGLALGAFLAGSFLLLALHGEKRFTENRGTLLGNAQEAPQAFQR